MAWNQENMPYGATCLPGNCCFCELASISNLAPWSNTKRASLSSNFRHDIAENYSFGVNEQSLTQFVYVFTVVACVIDESTLLYSMNNLPQCCSWLTW